MKLTIISLALCVASLHHSSIASSSTQIDLYNYNTQIRILHQLLSKECPEYIREKREVPTLENIQLEVKKLQVQELEQKLLECRKNGEILTEASNQTGIPQECMTATNFTQYWRLDHNGGDIRGGGPHIYSSGYACDLYDLGWFRFTGEGGTRMLNKCPKAKSCGTEYPMWTDAPLPQVVGQPIDVTVYTVYDSCYSWPKGLRVMRCSFDTENDVIYRNIANTTSYCSHGYCGMN